MLKYIITATKKDIKKETILTFLNQKANMISIFP